MRKVKREERNKRRAVGAGKMQLVHAAGTEEAAEWTLNESA